MPAAFGAANATYANHEYRKAQLRASYARNRDRRREEKFIAAYGITWADRDALIAEQDGLCAICRRGGLPLELDHCHGSLLIRGMLCGPCNRGIGIMENDPARLRRAADYLEQRG